MKKAIALTLTVLLVLSVLTPGVTLAETTYVNVSSGGIPPIVKCEWEQLPEAPYDDDPYTDGLQVLPPFKACAKKIQVK